MDKNPQLDLGEFSGEDILHVAAASGNVDVVEGLIDLLRASDLLQEMIDRKDQYSGAESCFLVRGKDREKSV